MATKNSIIKHKYQFLSCFLYLVYHKMRSLSIGKLKKFFIKNAGIFQPAFSFFLLNHNHENHEASNKHIGQNNYNKTQFIIFPELFAYNDKNGKDNRAKDNRENSKNKNKCCHFYFLHIFVFLFYLFYG